MVILGREEVAWQRLEETIGPDRRTTLSVVQEGSVMAGVQPLTGRQREALPEGIRSSVELRLYTKSELRTADQLTNTPSDRVIIDGETYRVLHVTRWRKLMAHYQVDVGRLKEPDDPEWSPENDEE